MAILTTNSPSFTYSVVRDALGNLKDRTSRERLGERGNTPDFNGDSVLCEAKALFYESVKRGTKTKEIEKSNNNNNKFDK